MLYKLFLKMMKRYEAENKGNFSKILSEKFPLYLKEACDNCF